METGTWTGLFTTPEEVTMMVPLYVPGDSPAIGVTINNPLPEPEALERVNWDPD